MYVVKYDNYMSVGKEGGIFLKPEFIKERLAWGLSSRYSDIDDVDTRYFWNI